MVQIWFLVVNSVVCGLLWRFGVLLLQCPWNLAWTDLCETGSFDTARSRELMFMHVHDMCMAGPMRAICVSQTHGQDWCPSHTQSHERKMPVTWLF